MRKHRIAGAPDHRENATLPHLSPYNPKPSTFPLAHARKRATVANVKGLRGTPKNDWALLLGYLLNLSSDQCSTLGPDRKSIRKLTAQKGDYINEVSYHFGLSRRI